MNNKPYFKKSHSHKPMKGKGSYTRDNNITGTTMKARTSKKTTEQIKPDTYAARIVGIAETGLRPPFQYQGKMIESKYAVEITYEFPTALMEDGRPFWVSEEITNSDNDGSALYKRCQDTSSDLKDLSSLIGKKVLVTVTHNDNGYAKIKGKDSVNACPSILEIGPLVNPTFIFDPYDNPDMEHWNKLPEFKQKRYMEALDWNEMKLSTMVANNGTDEEAAQADTQVQEPTTDEDFDDDIPF